MKTVVDYRKVNAETLKDLQYSEPSKKLQGKARVNVVNGDGSDVLVQSPKCEVVRLSKNSLSLRIPNEEFYTCLANYDDAMTTACVEHSKTFFKGKTVSRQMVEDGFKSCVSLSSFGKYNVKVSVDETLKVFDQYKKEMSFSDVKEGDIVVAILKLSGLWLSSQLVGNTLQLVQLKVYRERVINYMLSDEDEAEAEAEAEKETETKVKETEDSVCVVKSKKGFQDAELVSVCPEAV